MCGTRSPTVVLVHGWSCDRSYWDAQKDYLSGRYRVVTLDLAGHGRSARGRTGWTIAAFASDVTAVVGAVPTNDVVLVGHSMGGDVVLEAARSLRHSVRGVVWVDTYRQLSVFSSAEEVRSRLAPFESDFVHATRAFVRQMFREDADPALVERVVLHMSAAPPDIALAALESAWTFGANVPALLRELGVPVVAINPDQPATDHGSMQRHGVKVVSISGVGHFPMLESAERFNACLTDVIDAFPANGGRGSNA
ncbi:MAG TPA: alpha/beta hydrolase [Casimicrobiaceae bacterium]|nr:alpha/beta hydrolase [Casimicrobiaceae bacterium]